MRNLFTLIGSVNFTDVVITFVRLKDQGCNFEPTVLRFSEVNLLKFHVEISGIFKTMKGWKLHFFCYVPSQVVDQNGLETKSVPPTQTRDEMLLGESPG